MKAFVLCFEGGVEVSKGWAARKKANYSLFERKPRVLSRKSVAIYRRHENAERACTKVGWWRRRMAKAKRPKRGEKFATIAKDSGVSRPVPTRRGVIAARQRGRAYQ